MLKGQSNKRNKHTHTHDVRLDRTHLYEYYRKFNEWITKKVNGHLLYAENTQHAYAVYTAQSDYFRVKGRKKGRKRRTEQLVYNQMNWLSYIGYTNI